LAAAAAMAPVLASLGTAAVAATYNVDCTTGAVSGAATVSGSTASLVLGLVLGTPGSLATVSPAPSSGDTINVTGTCTEDVEVTVSDLTIANGSAGAVEGQIEVSGATGIVINGLLLGNASSFSFASASDVALVYAHDGAAVTVSNATIENSPLLGVVAARSSGIALEADQVNDNGGTTADLTERDNGGIQARDDSTVMLGAPDGSAQVTVSNNPYDAIAAYRDSSIVVYSAALSNNAAHQIMVVSASAAYVTVVPNDGLPTTTIMAPSGAPNAIQAVGTSTLRIDNGVTLAGASGAEAISVEGGSALLLQGSKISTPGAGPVIEATSGSVIALGGGNSICNGSFSGATCTAGTGLAIEIDHVASLVQINPADFGYTAAPETIHGTGAAVLQSTIDLGLGTVTGVPSVTWNTGAGAVSVAQNSSFRLDGGVTITGELSISQASNGFFNVSKGGANDVTQVICSFTDIPGSHVAGTSAVTPAVVASTNFLSTAANQCLSF
jgi:hypothetical protein